MKDTLIKRHGALRVESLGDEENQKVNDIYRVNQRLCANNASDQGPSPHIPAYTYTSQP